jgi:hypothetical protein
MRWLVIACVLAGCGKRGTEAAFCQNLAKLCGPAAHRVGERFTATDVAECTADLPKAKSRLGDRYAEMLACGDGATDCMEALLCIGDAFDDR